MRKGKKDITINLRSLCANHNHHSITEFIFLHLDSVLSKYFTRQNHNIKCIIVVGKGLNSQSLIGGKNIVRFATEKYLQKAGIEYKNGSFFEGQDGVIICYL